MSKRRRDVLRSIGATGVAATSTSIVAAGQQQFENADEESRRKVNTVLDNVEEVSDAEKESAVGRATETDDFRTLHAALTEDNASVELTGYTVYRSRELATYFVVANYGIVDGDGERKDGELLVPVEQSDVDATMEISGPLNARAVVKSRATPKVGRRGATPTEENTEQSSATPTGVSIYQASETSDLSVARYDDAETSSVSVGTGTASKLTVQSSEIRATGDGWGCAACKDLVGYLINTTTCSLEGVVACAIITSETGVGPVACPVAFAVICTLIYNEGLNNPENICGGCDIWGNKMLEAPCSSCDGCDWWEPWC